MNFVYHTDLHNIVLKEYGRTIQLMVEQICEVEDRSQRNRMTNVVIELMGQLSTSTRDMSPQDALHKLWDDLYIISKFELEVDSPFPMPTVESVNRKPETVPYPHHKIRFKHYGRNVSLMLKEVVDMPESPEKRYAFIQVARLMKHFYTTWNREIVDDDTILSDIETIIGRELPDDWISSIKKEGQLDFSEREKRNASFNYQQAQHLSQNLDNDKKKPNRGRRNFRQKNK